MTGGPIAMRAGQRLTVAMRQSRVLLRAIDDREGDVAESDTTAGGAGRRGRAAARRWRRPPLGAAGVRACRPRPASGGGAPVARRHAAGRRRWRRATSPSSSRTPSATCRGRSASSSSDDLAALADAARYRRRDDSARRALEAQRRRFHGSPRAADAAFFLGRLDENDGAGLIHALRWYDRYLDEAPTGSYAAEALGRKMVAMRDLYGVAAGARRGRRVRPPVPARQLRRRRAGAARPSSVTARGRRHLAPVVALAALLAERGERARRHRRRNRRPR